MNRSFSIKGRETPPGVAPAQLIGEDYRVLDSKETLRTTSDIEQIILMQTMEGHAHSGHGVFYGTRYPNTTLDDISKALRLSPADVKADRQGLIDEVKTFVERVVNGEKPQTAANADGEPLIGVSTLRAITIDPKGVLQGLYLGGLRDQFDIRQEAQERFGARIGFGKGYMVNRRVMHQMGLNGEILSQQGHGHEIEEFKRRGVIVEDGSESDDVAYMYIRHQTGPGASDDAAVVMAGRLFGLSAAIGCFLADAIDTLEKYVPVAADQDASISRVIEKAGYDLGVSRSDAIDLTYLAAVPEGNRHVPDSSLRHMLSVDRKIDQCVLESHLLYVEGRPFSCQVMDHGQCTNVEFYEYIRGRLESFERGSGLRK